MTLCFDCRHIAALGPRPRTDYLRIHVGQWGMLARGLAYCAHGPPGRFRSVHDDCPCPDFDPELDAAKRQGRRRVHADQAARFTLWINSLQKKRR